MPAMDTSVTIRAAAESDLEAINDINNHYIANTHFTLDLQPFDMKQRKEWFKQFGSTGRHRLLVACSSKGTVVGYSCSGPWRKKPGYDPSVETSVYMLPDYMGRGVGKKLYNALFSELKKEDVHRAYAGLSLPNDASVKFHEKFGFYRVAFFTEQGRKFDRYWDVAWFEKQL